MPNPGLPFDRSHFNNVAIHAPSVNILSQTIIDDVSSRDFFADKSEKLDWLTKAIEFMDLTTLAGDDTESNVVRLCYSATEPLPISITKV